MCGITGYLGSNQPDRMQEQALRSMTAALRHRGPDDLGVWIDADSGVGLGHRRLSILDLSPAGHQPMRSACGRYVIAFNGEIYNFPEIRKDLERLGAAPAWRGHSDTEVLLAAVSHWGFANSLAKLTGMFAIALWDRDARTLYLARDRIGEKPLYYGWVGETFLFGSELKALRAHPEWRGVIDRSALALYVRHGYVPAPFSIFRGIHKLPPATFVTVPAGDRHARQDIAPTRYWCMREVAESRGRDSIDLSDAEAIEALAKLLQASIARQMVADVPLGAFLSGGIDSSTVVALMQVQSRRPIRTFTIGFSQGEYNEANYARAVADHLGTAHTELYVSADDALAVIPRLPTLYDEPFSDQSEIPTFLVAKLAREHVTVSLTGDGGDELFGGYDRYFSASRIWRNLRRLPGPLRVTLANGISTLPPHHWDRILAHLSPILPPKLRQRPGDKLHKLANRLVVRNPEDVYLGLVSHWDRPEELVLGAAEPSTPLTAPSQWADLPDFLQRMMYLDSMTYLPDDILVKVDRAGMGVSLETRLPFLDHHVVEFAWRLPLHMKVRGRQGKWILRQLLYRHVPQRLLERPKKGFGVPLDSWLRGKLRDWAEGLLDERRLKEEGFFEPALVREKWRQHISGLGNWQDHLWNILMFEAWLESQTSAHACCSAALAERPAPHDSRELAECAGSFGSRAGGMGQRN